MRMKWRVLPEAPLCDAAPELRGECTDRFLAKAKRDLFREGGAARDPGTALKTALRIRGARRRSWSGAPRAAPKVLDSRPFRKKFGVLPDSHPVERRGHLDQPLYIGAILQLPAWVILVRLDLQADQVFGFDALDATKGSGGGTPQHRQTERASREHEIDRPGACHLQYIVGRVEDRKPIAFERLPRHRTLRQSKSRRHWWRAERPTLPARMRRSGRGPPRPLQGAHGRNRAG